jgi:hypothetical protein
MHHDAPHRCSASRLCDPCMRLDFVMGRIALGLAVAVAVAETTAIGVQGVVYNATWESLDARPNPEWWGDIK